MLEGILSRGADLKAFEFRHGVERHHVTGCEFEGLGSQARCGVASRGAEFEGVDDFEDGDNGSGKHRADAKGDDDEIQNYAPKAESQ